MHQYQISNDGYLLVSVNGDPVHRTGAGFGSQARPALSHVAVAYSVDEDLWTLHKHGDPQVVQGWAAANRQRLREAGAHEMAQSIGVLSGTLDLQLLNAALTTSGAVRHLVEYHRRHGGATDDCECNPCTPKGRLDQADVTDVEPRAAPRG